MASPFARVAAACLWSLFLNSTAVVGREQPKQDSDHLALAAAKRFYVGQCRPGHSTGKLVSSVWPTDFGQADRSGLPECGTNRSGGLVSEYPKSSGVINLSMAQISVGGIIRGDTLVSTSREFSPPEYFDYSSIIDPRSAAFEGAISQQDLVIWATDTITEGTESDYFYPRRHQPLFVKLTNSSYSWSYEYAEDFILFQLDVHNIGRNRIDSAYVAILTIPAVGHFGRQFLSDDDLGGFRSVVTTPGPCEFEDTLNVMWWADNDGDPINGVFTDKVTHDDSTGWYFRSCPFGFAIYILSPPAVPGRNDWRKATLSYNWWNYSPIPSHDFGPRRLRDYRDFGTGRTGTP